MRAGVLTCAGPGASCEAGLVQLSRLRDVVGLPSAQPVVGREPRVNYGLVASPFPRASRGIERDSSRNPTHPTIGFTREGDRENPRQTTILGGHANPRQSRSIGLFTPSAPRCITWREIIASGLRDARVVPTPCGCRSRLEVDASLRDASTTRRVDIRQIQEYLGHANVETEVLSASFEPNRLLQAGRATGAIR